MRGKHRDPEKTENKTIDWVTERLVAGVLTGFEQNLGTGESLKPPDFIRLLEVSEGATNQEPIEIRVRWSESANL